MLDEPFEAVDPVSAALIRDILHRYVAGGGTVIFSSHVMEVVERLCTPRGDPGRRHASSAVGTLDEVRGDAVAGGGLRRGGRRAHRDRRGAVVALPVTRPRPPDAGAHPGRLGDFVRLKLRVMGNGFRGQTWRVVLFVRRAHGRALVRRHAASSRWPRPAPPTTRTSAVLGRRRSAAAVLVLGWLLLPLVFFGVDETLDPARFALLPLTRRTLVTGLLAAALVGVPALATLLATGGLVVAAGAARRLGRRRWSRPSGWSVGCCSAWPPAAR